MAQGRIALGPDRDGGVYLIGLTRHDRHLLEDVPWHTRSVLLALRRHAASTHPSPLLLELLGDIDTSRDLTRCAASSEIDDATRAILQQILSQTWSGDGPADRMRTGLRRVSASRGPPSISSLVAA